MTDAHSDDAVAGLDEVAADLHGSLVRDITWFQPPEAKHLDPVTLATGFGLLLATSFLAGFEQVAREEARNLGRKTFRWLKGVVGSFFRKASGDAQALKPGSEEKEVAELARKAGNTAASLDQEAYEKVLADTERSLSEELQETTGMSQKKAEALSRAIRAAVEKRVLTKRRQRK